MCRGNGGVVDYIFVCRLAGNRGSVLGVLLLWMTPRFVVMWMVLKCEMVLKCMNYCLVLVLCGADGLAKGNGVSVLMRCMCPLLHLYLQPWAYMK